MRSRQALLSLQTFPDPVSRQVLEGACAVSAILGAQLTVQVPELQSDPSAWPAFIDAVPIDLSDVMEEMVAQSRTNAADAEAAVMQTAADHGVPIEVRRHVCAAFADPSPVIDLARLHDLSMLPLPESQEFGRSCAQAALFDSGRPVLLLPSRGRPLKRLDRIVLAWDHSREASRALADAMPLLERAREVRVVTVSGEKPTKRAFEAADLAKYLSAHGLAFTLHDVALEGDQVGRFLMEYAIGIDADLLVMGGYGHSRLREFVFGGATREILREALLPVLMSH